MKSSSQKKTPKQRQKFWETFRFHEERSLSERLRQILNADLLETVVAKCRYPQERNYWRSVFEGHSFRLTSHLAPRLHEMCQEVKEALLFDEPVEFFVTNNPTANAAAYLKNPEDNSHLIVFHSGLIEQFDDMELRFVIGHELGHVIFKTAEIRKLLNHLFPEPESVPIPLRNLISLWEKFSEISADRMGFVAAPDLGSCITNFFKLSSGLSLEKVQFRSQVYLDEIDAILEKYSESAAMFHGSHPTNPIRVKALQIFSESKTFRSYSKNGKLPRKDDELIIQMEELMQLLELHPNSELDYYRALIIAAGGFYLAGVDGKVSPEEEDKVVEYLANFTIHPRVYLQGIKDKVESREELNELLLDAIIHLVRVDPAERYPIFEYLCHIAIADRELDKIEIEFVMQTATQHLGMHEIEASRIFMENLRLARFKPRF